MRKLVTKILWLFARFIPMGLLQHLVKRDVVSIFYHVVSNSAPPHIRHLYPVVPVASFKSALEALKETCTFITYDQLHEHIKHGIPLPKNAVHLSFDDGFVECYTVVRPILLEAGIPCTFFLTIDWIDNLKLYFRHLISLCVDHFEKLSVEQKMILINEINREFDLSLKEPAEFKAWIMAFRKPNDRVIKVVVRKLGIDPVFFLQDNRPYLTSGQISEMYTDGFTIGAHGLSHRKLGFVPSGDVTKEIVESCQAVVDITGQAVVPFSFPQSAGNVNRTQLEDIRRCNPFIGYLFDTKDLRQDEPFMINRVWAERPLTPARILHPLDKIIANAYRDAWVDGILNALRKG
jgi:peptidoglycan/xylan/chitin deacetylase (PgdA/CDA1 family)